MQWRAYHQIQELIKERTDHLRENDEYDKWRMRRDALKEKYFVESPTRGFFQVDHIERVTDGGHPFDETNLQTLCKHCHHTKTAEENSNGDEQETEEREEIPLAEYTVQ
jgi:5-methylcytosine-specific restriction endonuclease McrA